MDSFLNLIKDKLNKNLSIENIEIIDNSHKHTTHKYFDKNKYHLILQIDSKYLKKMNQVEAQRKIMKILKTELQEKIHAIQIKIK
jgi:BolA family transcriptional regulator, general stress-responsive regulator